MLYCAWGNNPQISVAYKYKGLVLTLLIHISCSSVGDLLYNCFLLGLRLGSALSETCLSHSRGKRGMMDHVIALKILFRCGKCHLYS